MKKKILFSILAFVFCLPMMFLVTACGEGVKLESLELDTTSVKKEFVVGEEFTSAGLIVNGKYSDGVETLVTDFIVDSSAFNKDVVGSYVIYISCEDITKPYAVAVVEDYVVDFSVRTIQEKFFVGQEFKTNAVVTATYKSGKIENIQNYAVEGFDSSAAVSGQDVNVSYGSETAKIDVDVLNNEDYSAWVTNKLKDHVLSSNNCNTPFNESEPTAELDFEITTAALYVDGALHCANNGDVWYSSASGSTLWYDLKTNTLYNHDSVNSSATKRSFDSIWDMFVWNFDSIEGTYPSIKAIESLANPDAFFAVVSNTAFAFTNIDLTDNILTLYFENNENESQTYYLKLNYTDFTVSEYNPSDDTVYKFNQEVSIPEIPQNIEWIEA